MSERRLIVGLGNPGEKYQFTRHNAGYLVVQTLAAQAGAKFKKDSLIEGLISKAELEDSEVILLLPTTYMNLSGGAVKRTMNQKGIGLADLLIVYDDLAIPFGEIRMRPEGSAGGQNGMKSIIESLGTKDFARLRIGVGKPEVKRPNADYVLSDFSTTEKKQLPAIMESAGQCCRVWLTEGINKAMSQFNKRNNNE